MVVPDRHWCLPSFVFKLPPGFRRDSDAHISLSDKLLGYAVSDLTCLEISVVRKYFQPVSLTSSFAY